MATVSIAQDSGTASGAAATVRSSAGVAVLTAAQTGTGDSQNVAYRGARYDGGAIVVANVGTGSPTFTYTIQGSMDGTNYYNVPYALVATPRTFVVTAITTTTTNTITYLLQEGIPYQYLKLNISALTTETVTATAYL